ncbi:MAG TPA: hypothetical protein VNG51_08550 [Ktedonobacteraceae bacterium]|nr:hypothetical protein [Ktedonobacteraceae bacterium]
MNNQQNQMNHQPGFLAASWDAWKTARAGSQVIARRQQEHLAVLVSSARTHSRYFATCTAMWPIHAQMSRNCPL